ncbi:MAG: flippase-like domain-containing protein [Myxococcaceae bacterium]|nr:flippase-like domain-containing protein [Myxococcaceae bacterium]
MKRIVQLVVSLSITAVCFWWTFRHTNWGEMLLSLRTARWWLMLPYIGVLFGIHFARTIRWGALLSGIEKVKFGPLNEASAIGFMMLLVLPFRLGEFARPFLIAERSTIRRSAAMTTVVLERIVDGIVIAVLLRVLLLFVPDSANSMGIVTAGANIMFAVFGSGFVFLLVARWQHDRTVRALRAVFGLVSPRVAEKVVYIVDGFVGALKQLPDAKNFAVFILATAAYWVLNGWGMSLFASAFDGVDQLTFFQGYVVLSVLVCGLMIPAAPGSAGTFHAAITLALGLFLPADVVNGPGIAYANVLWLVQMAQQILFGLFIMVLSKRSFGDLAGKLSDGPPTEPPNGGDKLKAQA